MSPGTTSLDRDPKVLAALVLRPGGPRFGGAADASRSLSKHIARRIPLDYAEMSDHDEATPWEGRTYHFRRSHMGAYRLSASLSPFILSTIPGLMEEGKYDLLHLHNLHPLWACAHMAWRCRRKGLPYVFSTHGLHEVATMPAAFGLGPAMTLAYRVGMLPAARYMARHAAGAFALSPADIPVLRAFGVPDERITVIPNGVEDKFFERIPPERLAEQRARYRLPGGPLLVFTGHLRKNKGIDTLVRLAARLGETGHVVVVGPAHDEAYFREITALVAELGCEPRITFTGNVPFEDLPGFYQLADVFVFPSRADTMPLVVLEAMAAGTPIIASRVGGIPFQLEGGAGVIVEPDDVEGIATVARELLADEPRRRQMGEAARRRVEQNFRWERAADLAVEAYRKILAGLPIGERRG